MPHSTTPENTTPAATADSVDSQVTKVPDDIHDNAVKPDESKPGDPDQKPSTLELVLLLSAVFLSMFVVGVDRTIVSTVPLHSMEQS